MELLTGAPQRVTGNRWVITTTNRPTVTELGLTYLGSFIKLIRSVSSFSSMFLSLGDLFIVL